MTRDNIILYIRDQLNAITNRIYTREDHAYAYQLGFLLGFLAQEMLRDSHILTRFRLAVERTMRRPRC